MNIQEHFYIATSAATCGKSEIYSVKSADLNQMFSQGVAAVIGKADIFTQYHLYKQKSLSVAGEAFKTEPVKVCEIVFSEGLVDYQTAIADVPALATGMSHPSSIFDGCGKVTKEDQRNYLTYVKGLFAESAQRKDVVSDFVYKCDLYHS